MLQEEKDDLLISAVKRRDLADMTAALGMGASPDAILDKMKRRLLHRAAGEGRVDMVTLLLQHGANPNLADDSGRTPLFDAADHMNFNVVEALINNPGNPADINFQADDRQRQTALHSLVSASHASNGIHGIVRLMELGARADIKNSSGETPAAFARTIRWSLAADCIDVTAKQLEIERADTAAAERTRAAREIDEAFNRGARRKIVILPLPPISKKPFSPPPI